MNKLPSREEAGRLLAKKLTAYDNHPQAIVLGLPRGGILVAYEVARDLNLPLDVCLVRELHLPNFPGTAMGAVVEAALLPDYSGNITIIDDRSAIFKVDRERLRAIAAREQAELRWQDRCYRKFRPMLKIRDRVVIIVDDSIATGLTMHAAVTALRQHQPRKIIIATPVASNQAIEYLLGLVDGITGLIVEQSFNTVSFWYEDFPPVSDRQICDLLSQETHQALAVAY